MATPRARKSSAKPAPVVSPKTTPAIPLVVPAELADLAEQCRSSYRADVEIQSYKRFGKTLAKRLEREPLICAAPLAAFTGLMNGGGGSAAHLAGKALLLTNGKGERKMPVIAGRGMELVDDPPSRERWTFLVNKAIAEIEYDREVLTLKEGAVRKGRDLDTLNEIGMALSTEKDLDKLLEMIVSNTREMTYADGGSLYMVEAVPEIPEDPNNYFANKKMRFRVAQTFSRDVPFQSFLVDIKKSSIYGYVALTQEPLNLPDAYFIDPDAQYNWGGKEFDAAIGYRTMSMLTVPMVNYRGETIGVIQLINRKTDPEVVLGDPESCVEHIIPFTDHDERMALSIASQASIAIQNAQLVEDIQNLFNGFIKASVKAIESRDPTTSGHSQRVADLTVALAETTDRTSAKPFADVHFTANQVQELRYASLLHDFGKIGVRENVLVKAKKLYPHERQSVTDRFDMIRRTAEAEYLGKQVKTLMELMNKPQSDQKALALVEESRKDLQARIDQFEEFLDFILKCNEPTVLAQGGFDQLAEIAKQTFPNWSGEDTPFLSEQELVSLSVAKGSLNEKDRKEIESHVTHTYKFLSEIPWTKDLRRVPEIAYAHHEKLDGSGYPNRLTSDQIPLQSKMMTIADIFDALTAWDRPYKKAVPLERALNILIEEANANHVDRDLLDMFIEAELFKFVDVRE